MLNRKSGLLIFGLTLIGSHLAATRADSAMIVRVLDERLVYIDLGEREKLQPGELFEIRQAGETLGALEVLQVFGKISLAELLFLGEGVDPMLLPIVPIQDRRRLTQIEAQLRRAARAKSGPSRLLGVVPGLYQLKKARTISGGALIIAETVSLATGIAFQRNSNALQDQYDDWQKEEERWTGDLRESWEDQRDRIDAARRRDRRWGNRFFWLAGAVYAYNWIDVLWVRKGTAMSLEASPSPALAVKLDLHPDGWPMLQLVHRF